MLSYMRKHSKSWIAYIIFGAIIVVFVLWGGSSYVTREANKVAKIDRHIISMQSYQKAYSDMLKAYQNQFGDVLTPEMIKRLDLKKEVLNQLIDDYILKVDAQKLGVAVSDDELQLALRHVPAFQINGQFSMDHYRRILDYQRITPSEFEQQQRRSLLKQRFYAILTEHVVVSAEEIEATYKFRNDTFDLYFLPIDIEAHSKGVHITPEEIQAFYDIHKETYKVPPRTNIAYIEFPVQRYLKDIEVDAQDAQDFYDGHRNEFTTQAQVHPRHILLEVPLDAEAAFVEEKEKMAREILEKATTGKDFAALARTYSDDAESAASGGDLGLVPVRSLPEPLGSVLSAMNPGEIEGPVRSIFGFHVLKLEAKEEERLIPFEEVSSAIKETLRFQRARILAADEAESAFIELFEREQLDFAGYASKRGLDVKESGPFFEGQQLDPLTGSDVTQKAFLYPEGEIGDVAEIEGSFIVYMVAAREFARIPELDEIRETVTSDLRSQKARELAREEANKLASQDHEVLLGRKPSATGEFKRTVSSIPNLAMFPSLRDELDSLGNPKVYTHEDRVYVVWIKDRRKADMTALDEKKAQAIREDLLSMKRETIIDAYMEQARKKHKVTINWDKII